MAHINEVSRSVEFLSFIPFHLKANGTAANRVRSLNVDPVNISTGQCCTLSVAFTFHSTCSPLTSRIKAAVFCASSKLSNKKFLK